MNHLSKLRPGVLPIHYPDIPQSAALEALTGERYRLGDVMVAGERGFTLERMINLREGLMGDADALPPRLTDVPERADEPRSRVPLDEMKPVYYKVRDWDKAGVPNRSLLRKLGLEFAMNEAEQIRANPRMFRERARGVKENEDEAMAKAKAAIGTEG